MIKKDKEMLREVVWKDKKTFEIFRFLSILILSFFFLLIVYVTKYFLERVILIVFFFLSLYLLYIQFRRKLSSIRRDGLMIGNLTSSKWGSYDKKQDNIFIAWKDIKNINLINKAHMTPRISYLKPYAIFITKQGKRYESIIYDPQGFIQALKKVGKYNLMSKDSGYR